MVEDVVDVTPPPLVAPEGWVLGRPLALGGSAFVYEVKTGSGAPAVLKWGRWRDRDIHARFEREAEVLRALGPPATPAYIAHGVHDEWPWILMEEVPGETLAAWMARSGDHGALGEIVTILLRLAAALRPVHAAGYIHRDLKPENVVVGGHDARILDFGLAMHHRDAAPTVTSIVGTVHYLAPEQIKAGSTLDRRADIYSLGVIAFEMFAGQPPFTGERRAIEYQHQVSKPPSLRDIRSDVTTELEQVVNACLAKSPDGRPQTIEYFVDMLGAAMSSIQTLKGIGSIPKKSLGARDSVVLAWIEGGDPIAVSRAINDVHGMIVRSRPGGILAAFAAMHHDAPLAVALATCRELAHGRCRVVIHQANVLVRRSAQGKPSFYGPAIEQVASWAPSVPFSGLVLTGDAAEQAGGAVAPAPDVTGFWREVQRDRTDATEPHTDAPFVGRDRLLQDLAAIAGAGGMTVNISGAQGSGKSRFLTVLVDRLRKAKREVLEVRGRRRLFGEPPDDRPLFGALASTNLHTAVVDAGKRRAVIVVDDAHLLSPAALRELTRDDLAASRILVSTEALFEVEPNVTRRLAINLPPLDYSEAERLLRFLLQPARLIPDVLLQRLALRGAGNPGLLVALARDIRHRGGVRRHAGSDDWYVAADEIDTLLAAPSAAWLAARTLETLPLELAPIVRMASALGPTFTIAEVTAVAGFDAASRLALLVRDGVLAPVGDGYEFVDAALQDAIYDHNLDERALVHGRALRFWLAHRSAHDVVGWLARVAYHASATGELSTAATCYSSLSKHAWQRGEAELSHALDARALDCLTRGAPTAVADAVREIVDD